MSAEPRRRLREAPPSIPQRPESIRKGPLDGIYRGNSGEAPRPRWDQGVDN